MPKTPRRHRACVCVVANSLRHPRRHLALWTGWIQSERVVRLNVSNRPIRGTLRDLVGEDLSSSSRLAGHGDAASTSKMSVQSMQCESQLELLMVERVVASVSGESQTGPMDCTVDSRPRRTWLKARN